MKWVRNNPFWSGIALAIGAAFLIAVGLLWWTKGNFDQARDEYNADMATLRQLEESNPYPSSANVQKMREHLENYRVSLGNLKTELTQHVLPVTPLPPNEFQIHLREALTAINANARIHRVKLPESFNLGFAEFVAALPSSTDAPKFGQELAQIQLLLNLIIEARVDAIRTFRRVPREVSATATPVTAPQRGAPAQSVSKPLERNTVEFGISGSPVAVRRVINEICSASEQFFIIRSLHVKNQKDKGPPREIAPENASTPAPGATPSTAASPVASPSPMSALNFIVGNEHLDASVRVEMVNFLP
ncbi:MAG TPA: Amuc_1100 family pilus-like protein [Chthoniobacterales bacterium]|jgi:hypothetical protein